MFTNLVESSSHKGDYARRGSFFLGTLTIYALIFLAIGVGSIYAYDTHLETQNLELVALVTPVESAEAQPLQRPVTPQRSAAGSNSPKLAVVKTTPVTATMDPREISGKAMVAPPVPELPPGMGHRIGNPGPNDNVFGNPGTGDGLGGNSTGDSSRGIDELVKTQPPPVMKTETSKPPAPKVVRNIGVVNSMAIDLPKPVYTAIAKAAHASGTVTVQVVIDETGKVISARALSGHPLLQRESVQAAYRARFTPTLLSKQSVKVSGVITYNFVMR